MGKHSNLGPIDPHLNGIPAYGVLDEFKRAYKEIAKDPAKLAVWQPIIGQYRPTFLGQCQNAIDWSNKFVAAQLRTVMFKGKTVSENKVAAAKARKIVKELTDYRGNKTHNRHIHLCDCQKMGLKVTAFEDDAQLQDLVLTVHHCYMHVLMNTAAYKIIENQLGAAFIKQSIEAMRPVNQPRLSEQPSELRPLSWQ